MTLFAFLPLQNKAIFENKWVKIYEQYCDGFILPGHGASCSYLFLGVNFSETSLPLNSNCFQKVIAAKDFFSCSTIGALVVVFSFLFFCLLVIV